MTKDDILNLEEDEVVKCFITTMKQYVDEFHDKVTSKCKIPGRGISARFSTSSYGDFYMDYSCIYSSYSKEDAKLALEIFKHYSNIMTMYLEVLKFKYNEIEYEISKTIVSSSKIGKGLYVYNFPLKLPEEYYDKTE